MLCLAGQNYLVYEFLDLFGVLRYVLTHLLQGVFEFCDALEAWEFVAVENGFSFEIFEEVLTDLGTCADHTLLYHEVGLVLGFELE